MRLRAPPPLGRSRTCLRCSGQPPGARPVLPGRLIRPGSLLCCPLQARGDGGSACPSGACAPKLAAFPRLNGCPPGLTQTSPGSLVSLEPGVHTASRRAGQSLMKDKASWGQGCCFGDQDHPVPVSFAMTDRDDLMQILAFRDSSRWRSDSEPSRTCLTTGNQRCQP